MNPREIIAQAHKYGGRYSDFWQFEYYIMTNSNNLCNEICVTDNITATQYYVKKDIGRLAALNDGIAANEYIITQDKLTIIHNKLIDIGINFTMPNIYYVDEFPKPYTNMDWTAFAPDQNDYVLHGINPGIYFLKLETYPVYTDILLIHELIHTVAGRNKSDSKFLGRGLEDGLADLISFYIGVDLFGVAPVISQYDNIKVGTSLSQANKLYADYLRLAIGLYYSNGLDYISDLIMDGRHKIKKVEKELMHHLCFENSIIENATDDYSTVFGHILFTPQYISITPFELYVLERCPSTPCPIRTLAEIINCDEKAVANALQKIQDNLFFLLLNGDMIEYCDSQLYKDSLKIKYII